MSRPISAANEARIWEWLAGLCDASAANPEYGLGRPQQGYEWADCAGGLCVAYAWAILETRLDHAVERFLDGRLARFKPRGQMGYWWPITTAGYRRRAVVCRILAAAARREARS